MIYLSGERLQRAKQRTMQNVTRRNKHLSKQQALGMSTRGGFG